MSEPGELDRSEDPAGPCTLTWLALMGLTLGSYVLAESGGEASGALVLWLVLAKLLLVVAIFMELAHRGRAWLLPVGAFLALVVAVLGLLLSS